MPAWSTCRKSNRCFPALHIANGFLCLTYREDDIGAELELQYQLEADDAMFGWDMFCNVFEDGSCDTLLSNMTYNPPRRHPVFDPAKSWSYCDIELPPGFVLYRIEDARCIKVRSNSNEGSRLQVSTFFIGAPDIQCLRNPPR